MEQNKLFKDLIIIELASVLAGPAVGMFFAELGATVIKIENKTTGGDMTRKWKQTNEKDEDLSSYYASVNYHKQVKLKNLSQIEDQKYVHNLVSKADIVVANFKAGSAEKYKMDYTFLQSINSKLIYANISGFGENSNRPAFDLILQAETGFMSINGQADGPPTKMPVALIDILCAHQVKEGILAALYKREKQNTGSYITCSLYDSAIASLANQASHFLMTNKNPERQGSIHPNIAPYGEIFTTKDNKQLVLAIGTDKQFINLCTVLNAKSLSSSSNYSTNSNRVKNRIELEKNLQQKIALLDANAIKNKCSSLLIPYGFITPVKDVFSEENAKNLILNEQLESTATKRVKTVAFKIA